MSGSTYNERETSANHEGDRLLEDEPPEHRLPEKAEFADYALYPIQGGKNYFERLNYFFGWRFLVMMAVMYSLVKGMLYSMSNQVQLPFCKKILGGSGAQCQTLGVVAGTPWTMKGLIGVMSDAYPLFGYHKSSYILVATALSATAYAFLAFTPSLTIMSASLLLLVGNIEIALSDLLCEGRYSALMQAKPRSGASMVSYVWGCIFFSGLVASAFVGPISDNLSPQLVFYACVPLAASIAIPVALGYMGEERVETDGPAGEAAAATRAATMREHWRPVVLCILVSVVAMAVAVVDVMLPDETLVQLVCITVGCALALVLGVLWLPRGMAAFGVYILCQAALYIRVTGAVDFWYTADAQCVPGGPAFDFTYYTTYKNVVASVMAWVGVVLFQTQLSSWSFRQVFWLSSSLLAAASFSDVIMIMRWNLRLGISDHVFFLMSNGIIEPMVNSLNFMPLVVLISKMCTRGLESTTYALLCAYSSLGLTLSNQIGLFAMKASGVETVDPCNFDNLPALVFVGHCLLPLACVPLALLLIPDRVVTDPFDDQPDPSAATTTNTTGGGAPADGGPAPSLPGYKRL